ncbi:MAG TPA: protein kinase, partial [Pirellulales bacterium]|nr:protein kinase [Pirellulales bacterium]
MLDGLVQTHLARHGNDPEKSALALISAGPLPAEVCAEMAAVAVAPPNVEDAGGANSSDGIQNGQSLAPTVSFHQPPGTDTAASQQQSGDVGPPQARFGDYELLGEIARGGMGVVYKARHTKLNRLVALKMIKSGELADADQVKRFHAEAEAAAKLDHPGIVPVYEVGEANGQHFYSMLFVAGRSTNDLVKQDGPLPPRRAAELLKAAAIAVQFAHDRGIVHRDIKPQNILLDEDGRPRVADFGLAKQVEGTNELTVTGQVIGTPSYMPPEQARGALSEIGPASDVYSLGATLYFLLTGRPPFQTASAAETVRQVIEVEPVPLRRLNPAVPRDLETICLKCLRKEQARRFPTGAALADDLGRWLDGKPIVARSVRPEERAWLWCKRRPVVAGLSAALLMITTVGTLGAVEWQKRTRASAAVENVLTATADGVRYALDNLRPIAHYGLIRLRQHFANEQADGVHRLHAAYALADLGEPPLEFLLDVVPTAPASECRNLVAALEHQKSAAVAEIARRHATAAIAAHRARYAIVALQLGDPLPAENALALHADPIDRTTLIHAFAGWHGDLGRVASIIGERETPAFHSGLCAALGTITTESMESAERDAAVKILTELYLQARDGSTHSAAGWALRQWKQTLPAIEPSLRPPSERSWFVNGQEMTMVEIPAGKFTMGTPSEAQPNNNEQSAHEVTLTR